jgi:hypothetical protein
MQPTPSNPSGSNYRETFAYLCSMLPKSADDTPDVRAVRNMGAMDAVAALNPADAFEARLAARCVAMDAHAADALRSASLAVNDPAEMHRCRAQAASMSRQSNAALRALLRMQETREKQMAETHPAAIERAGYWFHEIPTPAPEPEPSLPADAAPFDQVTEAERYALLYPDRAARIRAARGLLAAPDFGPPEPELVHDLVHGSSPLLLALDCQRHNGAAEPPHVSASGTASHAEHSETMLRAPGTTTAENPPAGPALRSARQRHQVRQRHLGARTP